MLSDRVGLRKPFIYVGAVAAAACLFFAWYLAPGVATWILIFLGGFTIGGVPPILFTVPMELPEIGEEYVGGAAGVVGALMNLGGFLIPLLVISPIVAAGTLGAYTNGFLIIAFLIAVTILPVIPLIETGANAKVKGR